MTLEEAKNLKYGDIVHTPDCKRWKVNGEVKTWKRDPNRIRVPLKHGLYSYGYIEASNLDFFHIPPQGREYETCQT